MPASSSPFISAILAGLLLLLPSRVAAQAVPDSTGVRLDVSADARLGLQRLGGGTLATIGGRLWLTFPTGWRLGVGGTRGLNRITGGELEGSGLDARFGAGAVSVAVPLPEVRGVGGLEARFAVGTGAVYLDNALLGTTVDTETVWTLEPSILWRGPDRGPVRIGGEAGYRWVLGSDGLSRLDAGDLRTLTVALVVSFPAN
jgi:hypothetical protein